MPRVLIADSLSPAAVDIFRQRGVDVDNAPGDGRAQDERVAAGRAAAQRLVALGQA